MKKIYLLLFIVSVFAINAKAQVTIGSQDAPESGAVLELKSAELGFLPPRVSLVSPSVADPLPAFVDGMVIFNTHETDSLVIGLYYNLNSKWIHLTAEANPFPTENWFYMPSIPIDVSTGGTIDLYDEYKKQLNTAGVVKSVGTETPDKVLATVPGATDLYYYVTAYDDTVFENISITADGKMTYGIVSGASATDATFMNIVFVEK